MAFKKGVANGYLDMLFMLNRFLTSANKITIPTADVSNTGLGYISAEWASDESGVVLDSWTVEFTSATTFKVTGATNGLQSNTGVVTPYDDPVGFPYISDNGEIGFKAIQITPNFVTGDKFYFDSAVGLGSLANWTANRYNQVADSGVVEGINIGNGTIGNPNYDMYAPQEDWTITFTSGTSWTVSGSVSGSKAGATTAVPYDNGFISFTISASTPTAWTAGDSFTVSIPQWREIMWLAPGNAGTEEIFMGIQTYQDTDQAEDIFQWKLNGYTGYNPAADFLGQPSAITLENKTTGVPRCTFQDREMPYWIAANGRRVTMFYEVDQVIECMYLGFILPYGIPTENPYPMTVGGTTLDAAHPTTSNSGWHRAFWDCQSADSSSRNYSTLRIFNGTDWCTFGRGATYTNNFTEQRHGGVWPYVHSGVGNGTVSSYGGYEWDKITSSDDDSIPMFPLLPIVYTPSRITFGEIEGLFAMPGNIVNKKDHSFVGPSGSVVEYVYFANTVNINKESWCALRLE